MKRRSLLYFVLIFAFYTGVTFYIGWNGWVWLHSVTGLDNKWIYSIIVGLFSYSYIIGQISKRLSIFKIIGSYWFGLLQYAVLILPLSNLAFFILFLFGYPAHSIINWTGFIVLFVFVFLFLYGSFNAYNPVIRTYSITIPKSIKIRSNLRIAMASDMHFGRLSGLSHVKRLVREVNALKPDLILLPGDIIDDDPHPFIQKNMGDVMRELSAPLGVFGVLGNHEYYGGGIPIFLKEMERIGIRILLDEVLELENTIYLVGRKDKTDSKRLSISELVKDLNHDLPIIMMDHQPSQIKQAQENHVDLILSGHTHRGQMAPNHLITRRMFELDWGYAQKSQLHAVVSSGFGFWGPPLRIGSRSEIIQLNIQFSNDE